MVGKYKVITLCGSTRFKDEFMEAQKRLTLEGKQYKDAVFQYRSEWLQKQSLDVYIPSLRIGIEYQGQQHYHAVDFFGGKESYHAQIERDERKRKKCEEYNIGLIYWKYDTAINKKLVMEAIEMCKVSGFVEK